MLAFDVSMQFFITMQIIKTHEEFPHDDRYVVLGDEAGLHQVAATTSRAEFHNDPQVRSFEV